LLAGCSLLTGASDLEVGSFPDDAAPNAAVSDAARDANPPRSETGAPDGAVPDGTVVDGDAATRLRTVTFENGALTGALGADTEIGAPTLQSLTSVLDGKYSASLAINDGLEVGFGTSLSEVFVTFLIAINGNVLGTGVFFRLGANVPGSGTSVDLELSGDRNAAIQAKNGPVAFGPAGDMIASQTYRIGVHTQVVGNLTKVDVFLAPKGQVFGAPIVSGTTTASTKPSYVRVGPFLGGSVRCFVDDILVDSAVMPAPP